VRAIARGDLDGGAAPVVDARGNVWVSVGNGSVHSTGQAYDDSDSALELTANGRLEQYFAPSSWTSDNASDFDMSTAPVLLADGQVVLAGKSPVVYLLNGEHLGGIGKQEASLSSVCSNDIDGGSAIVGMTVYLPCLNGPVAVRVSKTPASLKVLWGRAPAVVRRSWRPVWCGRWVRTARCTDSTPRRDRSDSRPPSAPSTTTSRHRVLATA